MLLVNYTLFSRYHISSRFESTFRMNINRVLISYFIASFVFTTSVYASNEDKIRFISSFAAATFLIFIHLYPSTEQ